MKRGGISVEKIYNYGKKSYDDKIWGDLYKNTEVGHQKPNGILPKVRNRDGMIEYIIEKSTGGSEIVKADRFLINKDGNLNFYTEDIQVGVFIKDTWRTCVELSQTNRDGSNPETKTSNKNSSVNQLEV
jgi:hypothetical protein